MGFKDLPLLSNLAKTFKQKNVDNYMYMISAYLII